MSLKKNDNIIFLPNGYGEVIRLKFEGKIPEILSFLKEGDNEKLDPQKHDFVYFTTQEVMDDLLRKLDAMDSSEIV